ncbi:hypothetical protein Patl1_11082 [Pistacia atlantica]|uniref:Uncharacterized protein n=1 Tax=Pistacia atlantica TaxID=434234 RepID=A0ACC1A5X3_9ROSI|nr:hypothetical protein Patl1_11082 [Pistacia atlantica]
MTFMGSQGQDFDYSQRAQWLRAVVLGGMEGLVLTTLLMMDAEKVAQRTGADKNKAMLITWSVGLIAGAMRMAIIELVSVYTQVDTIAFQAERDMKVGRGGQQTWVIPSATEVAMASSLAYLLWGAAPLVAGVFVKDVHVRFSIAMIATSLSMVVLGMIGAALGKAPIPRSCARVLVGGLIAVSVMWGKIKILGFILLKI